MREWFGRWTDSPSVHQCGVGVSHSPHSTFTYYHDTPGETTRCPAERLTRVHAVLESVSTSLANPASERTCTHTDSCSCSCNDKRVLEDIHSQAVASLVSVVLNYPVHVELSTGLLSQTRPSDVFSCEIKTLSRIMDEEQLPVVHLLKVCSHVLSIPSGSLM
jgi:hypothetical protein